MRLAIDGNFDIFVGCEGEGEGGDCGDGWRVSVIVGRRKLME